MPLERKRRVGDPAWIGAALVLHAAALAAGRLMPVSAVAETRRPVETIDVELTGAPRPAAAERPREGPSRAPAEPTRRDPGAPAAVARGTEPAAPTADPAPRGPVPEPATAPTPPTRWDPLPAREGSPIPGLGGPPVYLLPGVLPDRPPPPPAPTSALAPMVDRRVADRILDDGLAGRKRELALDLPGAGAVSSALVSAVRGSTAPVVARARFVVRLGADGAVASARAVRWTDGDASAWQQAASAAAASLSGTRLHMPEAYAAGATLTIDVESLQTYEDGTIVSQAGHRKKDDKPSSGALTFGLPGGARKVYRVVRQTTSVSR